jgi:hypothetical protein
MADSIRIGHYSIVLMEVLVLVQDLHQRRVTLPKREKAKPRKIVVA